MMNNPTVVAACLVAAAATSAGMSYLLRPSDLHAPAERSVTPAAWRDLGGTLRRIQTEQERLALLVEELHMRPAGAESARIPIAEIEEVVARMLEQTPDADEATLAAVAAPGDLPASTDELFAELLDIGFGTQAGQELWQRIREAGRTDEFVALFEARVDEDPNDPELRLELGQAYLQKIQDVGQSPLAGVFATKADQAFDAALEIDPEHWDARFNKAVALSFWPPIFGKQSESIQQFELLIAQQAKLTPSPQHADAHLWLGNLYQQLGQQDKALAAWRTGSSLFPGHEGLSGQLALVGGGD